MRCSRKLNESEFVYVASGSHLCSEILILLYIRQLALQSLVFVGSAAFIVTGWAALCDLVRFSRRASAE